MWNKPWARKSVCYAITYIDEAGVNEILLIFVSGTDARDMLEVIADRCDKLPARSLTEL